jgi:hypothetical protein
VDDGRAARRPAERRPQAGDVVHRRVRHAVPGAQGLQPGAVRRREDALEHRRRPLVARGLVAVLEDAEDPATAVVRDDELDVGTPLTWADEQPAGVVQEREVAEQAPDRRAGPTAAQRDARGRGHRAVDAGEPAVGEDDGVAGVRREVEVAHRVARPGHEDAGRRPQRGGDLPRDERAGEPAGGRLTVEDAVDRRRGCHPAPPPAGQPR